MVLPNFFACLFFELLNHRAVIYNILFSFKCRKRNKKGNKKEKKKKRKKKIEGEKEEKKKIFLKPHQFFFIGLYHSRKQ